MALIIKRYSSNGIEQTEWNPDRTWDMDDVADNEGYHYAFSLNQRRSFLDEGRGASVAAYNSGDKIVEDAIPFGSSRS